MRLEAEQPIKLDASTIDLLSDSIPTSIGDYGKTDYSKSETHLPALELMEKAEDSGDLKTRGQEADFEVQAKELFPKLDANGDGILSKEELDSARSGNRELSDQEIQVVDGLLQEYDELSKLSSADRQGGVSQADLEVLAEKRPEVEENNRVARAMNVINANPDLRKSIDTNGDGLLSKEELREAENSSEGLPEDDRDCLKLLVDHYDEIIRTIGVYGKHGLSEEDADIFGKKVDTGISRIISSVDSAIYDRHLLP